MPELSLILPEIGLPDKTQDPKVTTALTNIQTWANEEYKIIRAGVWTPVESKETGVLEAQEINCRLEPGHESVRLRGAITIASPHEFSGGAQLLKLPVGFHPTANVIVSCAFINEGTKEPGFLEIYTTGKIAMFSLVKETSKIYLNGITYPIT